MPHMQTSISYAMLNAYVRTPNRTTELWNHLGDHLTVGPLDYTFKDLVYIELLWMNAGSVYVQ